MRGRTKPVPTVVQCRLLGRDPHRLLGLEGRGNLVFLAAVVEVQQMEPVGDCGRLLGRDRLLARFRGWRAIWLSTLIHVKVDLFALVSPVLLLAS